MFASVRGEGAGVVELSERQRRILQFIRNWAEEHDFPPSIRDIQQGCQVSSTSVVDYNLRGLERAGVIRRHREVSRAIELCDRAARGRGVISVPLVGAIAAGEPLPVPTAEHWSSDEIDRVEVPANMLRGAHDAFAVRVRGSSMIDALIDDGDIVILQPATDVSDGDMVAVWLRTRQETTLKHIYHEGNRVRLQPANSTMQPIYVPAHEVEVQGRVVAALRQA